jgi:hypothetical protein
MATGELSCNLNAMHHKFVALLLTREVHFIRSSPFHVGRRGGVSVCAVGVRTPSVK